ncbi:MAG: tetratricopeptide repeat protein [Bryobacteraceae bacterium]
MSRKPKETPKTPHTAPAAPQIPAIPRQVWIAAGVLFLACLAVFSAIVNHDFVDFDDAEYIHHNAMVREGLTAQGIIDAWTSVKHYYWQPLTWISHMTDVSLFGLNPGAHHAVSLLLHALNAAILLLALYRLTNALWPSVFAASLHALHPLRVESVAWAAERKDVLSGLFFSCALLAYANYARSGAKRDYLWLLLAAFAACSSKPTVVVLPLILLLLDWWPLGRLTSRDSLFPLLKEKLPLFAMSAVLSVLTVLGQQESAMATLEGHPLELRIWNLIRGYASYVYSFVWPANLGVFYPHEDVRNGTGVLMLLTLVGLTAAAVVLRRRAPYLLAGWLWFAIATFPMSGIAQAGSQAYADRFTYIPGIGLALAAVFAVATLQQRIPPRTLAAAGLCLLAVFAALSWQQTSHWKDTETMALRALAVTGKNPKMHYLLGLVYARQGRTTEATNHFRAYMEEFPEGAGDAHQHLGTMFMQAKNFSEAERELRQALESTPNDLKLLKLYSLALVQTGRREEATQTLRRILSLQPGDREATSWLGSLTGAASSNP